ASMQDEAELATVLGHELTHYVHRHALRQQRTQKQRWMMTQAVMGTLAMATVAFTGDPNAARTLMQFGNNVVVEAQVSGYSRDLEREADERGLQSVIAAGYDPREAGQVFERLREEAQEANIEEPYFFGKHPRLEERITTYQTTVARWQPTAGETPRVGREEFAVAVNDMMLQDARIEMVIGRPKRARGDDRAAPQHATDERARLRPPRRAGAPYGRGHRPAGARRGGVPAGDR